EGRIVKRCRTCLHVTAGDPPFCPSCGGSYNKRICAKGHLNPRSANICSACGSRDLSHAQPRRRFALVAGVGLLKFVLGVTLLLVTVVYAVSFAIAAARDATHLLGRMLIGAAIGLAWAAFAQF